MGVPIRRATSSGGRSQLVRGAVGHWVEIVGTPSGGSSEELDTMSKANGWFSLSKEGQTADICIRNDIGILGGRLAAGQETAFGVSTYLVRDNVVVPGGSTAVFPFGSVLKFTENTRLVAESGGQIVFRGVALADALDDSVGDDADFGKYESLVGGKGAWITAEGHSWSDLSFVNDGQPFGPVLRWTADLPGTMSTYGNLPCPPDKAGKHFEGWYTQDSEGALVSTGTVVVAGARTLYAHWKVTSWQTVTFDANGGKCGTKSKKFAVAETYSPLPTATKSGQAFAGWWTAKSGGTNVTAASVVTSASKRTLYAHWTTKQTANFDANGGTCTTESKTYAIGKTYGTLPTATLAGQAFTGWFTAKKGGTKVVATTEVTEAAKRTLYAHWTTTQTAQFDANGGTCTTESKTYTIGKTYGTLPTAALAGQAFAGW